MSKRSQSSYRHEEPYVKVVLVMLIGSIGAMLIVPPFLHIIERTGSVNFYGITFLSPVIR